MSKLMRFFIFQYNKEKIQNISKINHSKLNIQEESNKQEYANNPVDLISSSEKNHNNHDEFLENYYLQRYNYW